MWLLTTSLASFAKNTDLIAINLFWHGKYNRDPANKWFRQLMFDLFSD